MRKFTSLFNVKRASLCFISFLILSSSLFICKAQTIVTGPTSSGHWTLAGSPYNIQNSVYIPNDSTLTIDPGVTVKFQTSFTPYIHVLGRLLAIGTPADSIYFTASDTTDGSHGIRFYGITVNNDTSKLEYCKIQYGKADGSNYYVQNGGALFFNHWSKAIVAHCYIANCNAINGGGAIYCDSSRSPLIISNTIRQSYVPFGLGGGIFCYNLSQPVISYNTIEGNYAGSAGGGIASQYCENFVISNNIISNNAAAAWAYYGGGGVYIYESKGIIFNNTISHNYIYNGEGCGVYCGGDTVVILNNTVSYNTCNSSAGILGGGITCWAPNSDTIANNIIANNTANDGGGIYLYDTGPVYPTYLSNNSIINNMAAFITSYGLGGGLYCTDASPAIINTTFSNNYSYEGGGIYCTNVSSPTSRNCIYWGDTATASGNELFQNDQPSTPNYYYCDVQGAQGAFGLNGNFYLGTYSNNINSNPTFVSPSAGKGTAYDGVSANWALQNGSPCIDAGDPLYSPYPATDLAGSPRIVVCRIDMGAYENQYGVSAPLQITISGTNAICRYDSTTITAHGATTYNWSPSAGLSATNIANPVAKPTVQTTYTVIGTSGVCEAMDTITIFIKSLPVITFSGNDSTCKGTPSTIIASGGGTYVWSNSSTTSSITVNPSLSNTYTVAVTNNGCTKDSTFTLTVNPLPTLTISNDLDTLKISGAATYLWSTGSTNDTTIVHQQGTYYVTGTDANGCVSQDSITIILTNVEVTNISSGITVYPIPAKEDINVMLTGTGYISVKIMDRLGREICTKTTDLNKPIQNIQFNLENIPSGIYMVQVISDKGVLNQQIIIQK